MIRIEMLLTKLCWGKWILTTWYEQKKAIQRLTTKMGEQHAENWVHSQTINHTLLTN